jgi:hypothetical protein
MAKMNYGHIWFYPNWEMACLLLPQRPLFVRRGGRQRIWSNRPDRPLPRWLQVKT